MPTRTYSRKNGSDGLPADPSRGNPSFLSGVATALPGRTWRSVADGSDVTLLIDGGDLTAQEDTDLTAAHTAWVTYNQERFQGLYQVTTEAAGKAQKVEWFQTDNGDGTYSDLARDEVYNWSGNALLSIVHTTYTTDGGVVSQETESFFTTSDGKRVKKVS